MGNLLDFDFFLVPEAVGAIETPEVRPTRDTATDQAEAWARRAMAASGFGETDLAADVSAAAS